MKAKRNTKFAIVLGMAILAVTLQINVQAAAPVRPLDTAPSGRVILEVKPESEVKNTPLMDAAERGNIEALKVLTAKGADVNESDGTGSRPLIRAASKGHLVAVQFLIEKGALVEVANKVEYTPLLCAVDGGHLHVVKTLLEKGAKVIVETSTGTTPLMLAAGSGDLAIVKLLISNGANINAKGLFGSPLSWALGKQHEEVIAFLRQQGAKE